MDLTEISAPRITKMSSMESKDRLIMASSGSLISAGKPRVLPSTEDAIGGSWV